MQKGGRKAKSERVKGAGLKGEGYRKRDRRGKVATVIVGVPKQWTKTFKRMVEGTTMRIQLQLANQKLQWINKVCFF